MLNTGIKKESYSLIHCKIYRILTTYSKDSMIVTNLDLRLLTHISNINVPWTFCGPLKDYIIVANLTCTLNIDEQIQLIYGKNKLLRYQNRIKSFFLLHCRFNAKMNPLYSAQDVV